MDASEAYMPLSPSEHVASPAVTRAAWIVGCGLAMLPILYVGSFTFLMAHGQYGWGLIPTTDPATEQQISDALVTFYWPLIELWFAILGSE